jgi:hypothetical protein
MLPCILNRCINEFENFDGIRNSMRRQFGVRREPAIGKSAVGMAALQLKSVGERNLVKKHLKLSIR